MVFANLVFLYVFLPLNIILYFCTKNRAFRNAVLIFFSLAFYSWGEPVWVTLLIFSATIDYFHGLIIEKNRGKIGAKLALISSLVLNLGLLGIFKYSGFFVENINLLLGTAFPVPAFTLPIGISFYTFQTLSYTIDVYRGNVKPQHSYMKFFMYVSLYCQLVAGPIVRYADVAVEVDNRRETLEDVYAGTARFLVGLTKKVFIANIAGKFAEDYLSGDLLKATTAGVWFGIMMFAIQIYYDFSGYSDMAIGLGRIFGFHFLENFNYPYISLSVTEFWRRWHISLSTWFRDYVYIPLGGNRVSRGKWVRNILAVWGLTGLWHGADWNFLLWGLYYGVLLLIEKLWLGKYLERLPKALRWLLCMILVCIGWVMFNLTDFVQMRCALARMFRFTHVALSQSLAADVSIVPPLLWMLPALVFSTPVCRRVHLGESCGAEIVRNVVCLALLAVCIVFSVSATFNPFIYFRF